MTLVKPRSPTLCQQTTYNIRLYLRSKMVKDLNSLKLLLPHVKTNKYLFIFSCSNVAGQITQFSASNIKTRQLYSSDKGVSKRYHTYKCIYKY